MEEEHRALIDDALGGRSISDGALQDIERLGDVAFDEIVQRLESGTLSSHQQIMALRVLAGITRLTCVMRKEEVLELAMDRLNSDDVIVRSGAVNTTIWIARMLEENPNLALAAKNKPGAIPSLTERVKGAVSLAVQRGVDRRQAVFARGYLTR